MGAQPFGAFTGSTGWGLRAGGATHVKQPYCAFGEGRAEAAPQRCETPSSCDVQQCAARRQPAWHLSAGTEVSWSSMRSAASGGVFSPLKSCFTGLMKKQTFSALVGAFFFFFNANLVEKRGWLVAVAGLSECSIMASEFKGRWRCCLPPPKLTSGECFNAKTILCAHHQRARKKGKKKSPLSCSQANKIGTNKSR